MRRTPLPTAVAALALTASVAACGSPPPGGTLPSAEPLPARTAEGQPVTRGSLNYLWPFTVDRGVVSCAGAEEAVFTAPDGIAYGLNGRARAAGHPSPDPIVAKRGGDGPSLGAVISLALRQCGGSGGT